VPVEVHADITDGERPGEHRHNAIIRFDTGAMGVFMCHYGVGYRIQRAEAHARDLSAYLELSDEPRVELSEARPAAKAPWTDGHRLDGELDLEAVGGRDYDEVRHFTDCILEDREPWSTLDDAVHTVRLAEAIRAGHRGPL
jgi:predicted dehydrogenase